MPISNFDRQILIIQQVGDVDANTGDPVSPLAEGSGGIILQNADRIWSMHEGKFALPFYGGTLFNYYFKRDAVALVIGVLESRVDFSAVGTAMSVKLNQRIQARMMQSQRYTNEIIRIEGKLEHITPPSGFSLITQIEPITPPVPGQISSPLAAVGNINTWVPDANDPAYSGSPYWARYNRYPFNFR